MGRADLIFVMEKRHPGKLREKLGEEIAGKPVVCLYIPDDYDCMDEEPIDRLRGGVARHVDFGEPED